MDFCAQNALIKLGRLDPDKEVTQEDKDEFYNTVTKIFDWLQSSNANKDVLDSFIQFKYDKNLNSQPYCIFVQKLIVSYKEKSSERMREEMGTRMKL